MGRSQVIGFAFQDWGKNNLVIICVLESNVYLGSPAEHGLGGRRDWKGRPARKLIIIQERDDVGPKQDFSTSHNRHFEQDSSLLRRLSCVLRDV